MRESIICSGRIGVKPYRFPETGIEIFSYEELCYYLSEHMLFYLDTLPEENLLVYLKDELGMESLYRQLCRLDDPARDQMKYFSALFREGNYFSEEDIREILDDYRNLKNTPAPMQKKWLGDQYLKYHRSSMAIQYYREALSVEKLEASLQGAIYHNMAIAKARLFRMQDACVDFLKAYQYGGEEESLFYYYCIIAMTEDVHRAEEEMESFEVSDILLESFEERYVQMRRAYEQTNEAESMRCIAFLKEKGREEDAEQLYTRYIGKLRKEFRKELYINEKLSVTNCS